MSKKDLKRVEPKFPNQKLNLVLPLAVSVNHLYMFKKGRRFMTKAGQEYMKKVFQITEHTMGIQNYIPEQEGVWQVCELTFYFPDKRVRDCHNMHKLVMDALEGIAFPNDRWILVRDMHVGLDKEFPRIEVKLYPHKYE